MKIDLYLFHALKNQQDLWIKLDLHLSHDSEWLYYFLNLVHHFIKLALEPLQLLSRLRDFLGFGIQHLLEVFIALFFVAVVSIDLFKFLCEIFNLGEILTDHSIDLLHLRHRLILELLTLPDVFVLVFVLQLEIFDQVRVDDVFESGGDLDAEDLGFINLRVQIVALILDLHVFIDQVIYHCFVLSNFVLVEFFNLFIIFVENHDK